MYVCPLCEQEFEIPIKLGNHLKSGDNKHQFLRELIRLDKKSNKDFQEVYDNHKEIIDKTIDVALSISDYKGYLEKQKKEEKEKKQQEKLEEAALKQAEKNEKIEAKKLAKLEKQKAEAEKYKQILEAKQFKKKYEKKYVKELDTEFKPLNLVKYFYELAGVEEYNSIIATSSIKSLYFKHQLEPEFVKKLLRYTAETGHSKISDAKFLIEEAERFYQYAKEINEKNSIPSLIKKFYDAKHTKIDKKMFVKLVDRIKSLMKENNLTFENADSIINYMIENHVNSLFWFNDYVDKINNVSDPCVNYDIDREIDDNVEEVMHGHMKFTEISQRIANQCFKKLKSIILSGNFDENYNYSEWLYKIRMYPDKEMIEFIKNHAGRNSKFKSLFEKYKNDSVTYEKVMNEYNKFKKWMKKE